MAKAPGSKPVWGINISASAIAGVQMRVRGERVEILNADIIPLSGAPSAADSPGRDRRIWQALQQFQARHSIASERVAVGLPGSVFFMRPFNLFLMGDRSEGELVRFEMEQHIPFGLDAVLWDYELFEAEDPAANERSGLLFAMKKEVLNNYFLSIGVAGVEPIHVQAAPLALYHFIKYELQPQDPMLAMEIGLSGTNLILIDGMRYWIRAINVGGDMITSGIQEAFKPGVVSRPDAESIRSHLPELTRRAEVMDRLMPPMRHFVGELRNAVTHLLKEHHVQPERLVLLGPEAEMYGLRNLLASELKMRVVTPAGLGRIDIDDGEQRKFINANLPSLASAIGVGLQVLGRAASRVNMVGATLLRRRSQTRVRRVGVSLVAAIALLVMCLGGFASWHSRVVANKTATLRELIDPISNRRRRYMLFVEPGQAEQQMSAFRQRAVTRELWLTTLDKISRMLPENESEGVPAAQKLWLINLAIRERPSEAGVFECVMEVGALLRPDGRHRAHVERTIIAPLRADERGIFRNVEEIASGRSSNLSFSGDKENDRYYVARIRFETVMNQGAGR